jgi:hypothetical protein
MKNIMNNPVTKDIIADGQDKTIIGEPTSTEAIELKDQLQFIAYELPHAFALCRGILRFKLGETEFEFGGKKIFWHSGGSCGWNIEDVDVGPWCFDWDNAPSWLKAIAPEFEAMFNENVPWGCCGGCT